MKNDNNSKKPLSEHLEKDKQDLLKKLGITEEVMQADEQFISQEEDKKSKIDVQKENSKKELNNEIGWKNPKELGINLLFGCFMGLSDAIPGYSGGTTMSIIGFFEKLVYKVKNIFKQEVKGTWWKYLLWFLPFLITWVGFLLLMMYMVDKASEANQGVVLVFLFGFFSICSIPFFVLANKKKLPWFVTDKGGFKSFGKEKGDTFNLILIIVGFLIMLTIALVVRFAFDGGVTFIRTQEGNLFDPKSAGNSKVFLYLFAGFLAGFCLFIPGISGGLMLYLCNVYPEVSQIIGNILDGVPGMGNYAPYLAVLVLGGALGIIVSVIFVNWISKKYEKSFYSLCLGLVSGSFIAIFVSLSANDYATLSGNNTTLGLALGMIPLALVINVGIFFALNQFEIIQFPKLYFGATKKRYKARTAN